ncbi:hypothetical protein [Natranaeroarchaeum aerophilus]|uniref:Uncharacterized protein n=1 Tax=Natranaeroarchaeum aerophilus TaxID=2917711 RepID=A0AAE3K5C6_9EURY|nr:hypothetical protein [Natranaeroarchaeum aerophilus]MCL9813310.1 hypothetical protein [Natranaeroarchaeum aerophilus]
MSGPPEDPPTHSTGPPDRQTLRLLARHLSSESLLVETAFDPDSYEPRLLRGVLDAGRYPDSVTAARLDIRWFTTGDFSIHYVEVHEDGTRWECRWDRHPNTHNTRLHFHEPPSAVEVADLDLPSLHPLDVYSTVLAAIEDRIETLWSAQ